MLKILWDHRTAITGGLQATSALLATASVIPASAAGFIALGIGLLQIWIGVANSIASGKKD
jgi:hypothetical protein